MPYNPGVSPTSAKSGSLGTSESLPQTVGWLSLPEMRYQNQYVWFVFFSALDIMLTWAILRRGGREVNPVADQIIDMWGLTGAILFKFSLTMLVVIVCEVVGRKRLSTGTWLATTAMVVSAIPV
ncbi:MAG TPA: DUF5658 family protein, partial [Phycisphaerales bacterium]|nr:DUF5658 family protein [Phycisphaerales bacterium]